MAMLLYGIAMIWHVIARGRGEGSFGLTWRRAVRSRPQSRNARSLRAGLGRAGEGEPKNHVAMLPYGVVAIWHVMARRWGGIVGLTWRAG